MLLKGFLVGARFSVEVSIRVVFVLFEWIVGWFCRRLSDEVCIL